MLISEFDLEVDDELTLKVQVYEGKYSPTMIWENREKWLEFVEKSRKVWEEMSEDRREGLTLVVKHAMQRLHDKIDTWLPEAIEHESGNCMDVHFKIMFTDADREIQKHSAMTAMRLSEAETESLELLNKLRTKKLD